MLVVIEGSDFSGKSTIASLVAIKLASVGIHTRRSVTCLHDGVLARVASSLQRQQRGLGWAKSFVFHAAYVGDFVYWRDNPNTVTLQESYLLRVMAHDHALRRRLGRAVLEGCKRFWPAPDVRVLLCCSLKERIARWHNSGSEDTRDFLRFTRDLERTLAIDNYLEHLCAQYQYTKIDTEGAPIHAVADQICALIRRRLQHNA